MSGVDSVNTLIEQYLSTVSEIQTKANPLSGLFGFGASPKDHPCHEQYIRDLETCVESVAAEPSDVETIGAIIHAIINAQSLVKKDSMAYWTLIAGHGAIRCLIPLLTEEKAVSIAHEYEMIMRPRERMPLQEQILRELRKRGGLR